MNKKALKFTIISLVGIAIVVGGAFFGIDYLQKQKAIAEQIEAEQVGIETKNQVSSADEEAVKIQNAIVFAKLTEFGYQVPPAEREGTLGASENSFIARKTAHQSIKENLYPGSPLNYSESEVNAWKDDFEITYLVSYSLQDVKIDIEKNYSSANLRGNNGIKAIEGEAEVTSLVTYAIPVGSESPDWDGTYEVLEKPFTNKIKVTYAQDSNGDWKLFQASGAKDQWVFAYDQNPDINSYVYNIQNGNFKVVDSFKTVVPESQTGLPSE